MSDLDALYERNQEFARTFDQGDLPIMPRHLTIILTCLDALIASGRLSIITNNQLQLSLIRLNQNIADFQGKTSMLSQNISHREMVIGLIEKTILGPPNEQGSEFKSRYQCDWSAILSDHLLVYYINQNVSFYTNGYAPLVANILTFTEDIHEMIDTEIGQSHPEAQ